LEIDMSIGLDDVATGVGTYLVASLVFASLLVRIATSAWPSKLLRRHVWAFPLSPIFGSMALLGIVLLVVGQIVDVMIRGSFRALSGKRAYRRVQIDSYYHIRGR